MVLNLLLGAPAAFVFARYVFPGQEAQLHVPDPVAAGAGGRAGDADLHDAAGARAWSARRLGIILVHTAKALPFTVLILSVFFRKMPAEIFEAAVLDHCSRFQTFWRIALPLALPSIGATGLFAFMLSYSEYMFSMVLSGDAATRPVSVVMAALARNTDVELEPPQHRRSSSPSCRRWCWWSSSGASSSKACSAARSRDRTWHDIGDEPSVTR